MIRQGVSAVWIGVMAVVLAGLTGCSPVQPAPTATRSSVERSSTPAPTPTGQAAPARIPANNATYGQAARVGEYDAIIPVDHGPEQYAQGTVHTDAHGIPVAYTVASGDITDFVAERLGLGYSNFYLMALNQVRRGERQGTLYAGDVLNLSPFTITTVGTINGRVLSSAPPSPMPAQSH